ncbi:acriflavin resistance protein [Desulfurispirillum indicum S5]|uniref:Acriflavin resistance protein n=1 Tax=Desulfurispirillum indicum (strain ATCC BAA-1389 / DSM 22839 / S5) TaxID=653733 RepID=E6W3X0_DESIS|nr:efflux RND transporter permease subunit [Desulfurispirillum indicum]ADU65838.1 acriflavin resistance protein [Desulfurispirillum indicum S5]
MNPSSLAVQRPIGTIMVIMVAVFFGLLSLSRLPIDLMPDMTYPTLSVVTTYDNASPEEVERLVTIPLERALGIISGIETINSTSSRGTSVIRLSFTWGTDLDVAANDIRDRLDRAMRTLPEGIDRPQLRKFDVSAAPILILGATANLDPATLRHIAEEEIGSRLERIAGVAGIEVWGGRERQITIRVNPVALESYSLTLQQVQRAVEEANRDYSFGEIQRGDFEYQLRYPSRLQGLEDFPDIIVERRNDNIIRLHQIATIEEGHVRQERITRINGEPGVRIAVRKQDGSNTVEVAERVKREMLHIERAFPQFRMITLSDTSTYIQRAIANISYSMLYGGSLAVIVLLFFLRDIRSTVAVATAIPVSVVATFVPVYFSGLSLNIMTLGGLALGIGMMVDNSIVVQENINFLRRTPPWDTRQTASLGARQVTPAIIASTLTTMVIFLPLFFTEGISGLMFRQMAYVVAFALLCSLIMALLLVPVLNCGGNTRGAHTSRWSSALLRIFNRMQNAYERVLHFSVQRRFGTFAMVALLFILSLNVATRLGSEFMPAADESSVRIFVEMPLGTRMNVLDEQVRSLEEQLRQLTPELRAYDTRVSRNGRAEVRLSLLPPSQRQRSSEQIASDLRRQIKLSPGTIVRTRAEQGLFIMRMLSSTDDDRLEVVIRGHNIAELERWGDIIEAELATIPGITDVRRGQFASSVETHLRVNHDLTSRMGVQVEDVMRAIRASMDGYQVSLLRKDGRESPVYLAIEGEGRGDLDAIGNLRVRSESGQTVVLRQLVSIESADGPREINRRNQQRFLSLSANNEGRDIGSIGRDIEELLIGLEMSAEYSATLESDFQEQQKAFRELIIMISLAVLLVFMILAALYESVKAPLIVMVSVPMAFIGAIMALWISGSTINMQSLIGMMMLAGIVVNNAILIVDYAIRLQARDGLSALQAGIESAKRRFRPVLMTSLTTMLALMPLALGIGEGSEAQAPMARAVIGGLFSSTAISLFIIPIVYHWVMAKRGETLHGES